MRCTRYESEAFYDNPDSKGEIWYEVVDARALSTFDALRHQLANGMDVNCDDRGYISSNPRSIEHLIDGGRRAVGISFPTSYDDIDKIAYNVMLAETLLHGDRYYADTTLTHWADIAGILRGRLEPMGGGRLRR